MKKLILIPTLLIAFVFTSIFNNIDTYAYFTNQDSYFNGQVTYSSNDSIFFESATNEFFTLKTALVSYIGFSDPTNTKIVVSYSFVPADIMIDDSQLRDIINITTIITFESPNYFAEFDIYVFDVFNKEIFTKHYNDVADLNNMVFDSIVINSVTGTYAQGHSEGYSEGYIEGYNEGEDAGLNINQQEAYDSGFIEGSNDSFLSNLGDWMVPAIIITLLLGGVITLIRRKREN